MGREVRRVPVDWVHPQEHCHYRGKMVHIPLMDRESMKYLDDPSEINPDDYMPEFPADAELGYCIYETVSEGTPLTPVFKTPEDLAIWAMNNPEPIRAGNRSFEGWMKFIQAGWAPSFVADSTGLKSGVEYISTQS